ncbi:MAG TPA: MarP family serine protease [Gaiella sp.]|jgi:S1-C subfamily serine protease|nr:MarP family serine protease [Gaiella sp.]
MNRLDWIALAVVVLTGVAGVRRGLVTGVLSLGGLVAGAIVGARAVPAFVGLGGWTPLVALAGAAMGGILGQYVGLFVGHTARRSLLPLAPLRIIDSAGGVLLGLATGLALCWVVGAALLYVPGQSDLRRLAQDSSILSGLTQALPPEEVMNALQRIDPFSAIVGPATGVAEPDPAIARDPEVRRAGASVVRVRGYACGLGIEGSGWIVRPGFVVTNAHVVAGIRTPVVYRREGQRAQATVVSFDADNDVAILRVEGLKGRPLPVSEPQRGDPAALLGFPLDGPYTVSAVRMGGTARVATRDAYGRLRVGREVVGFRGEVQSGNSGGPIVDRDGHVVATVFAKRQGSDEGYAVPNGAVADALGNVSTHGLRTACVER